MLSIPKLLARDCIVQMIMQLSCLSLRAHIWEENARVRNAHEDACDGDHAVKCQ